ncbi:MAG TPA: response regulator [Candidatus Cloacimonadota bacterium]|jgi:DNA-binding NtrC family response regulator|nr:response regulator [Candidatus Cloacimonadota bacterium]HOD54428.1 response regulator [Candidatus Cloacimonadota bacterium]HPM00880.1 response regulator [Candidatus Cloacimonadota bacterium]
MEEIKDTEQSKIMVVVDDENDILELLQSEITDYDETFNIKTFHDGLSALQFIKQNKCDILITDIAMPDMDGYELYSRVKELRPALPIIMMTGFGYDPNHIVVNAKKAGLKDVIFKPFDINRLMTMIYQRLSEVQV